jgi:sigma-B regulation protein RsbU (phosphoserine phosphatase)
VTPALRAKLLDRRQRLERALSESGPLDDLVLLVQQVDQALARMDRGTYGGCRVCGNEVEEHDLAANPFLEYCLCRLSSEQQRALEHDIDLARRIQAGLLPRQDVGCCGWRSHYRYRPAGAVSGDYCDVVTTRDDSGDLWFAVGDVSGKGIAAALLMAHLNASFRSLIGTGLPPEEIVARQNRLLLESDLPSHYATLVCGRAMADGRIDLVNAGHCAPLVARGGAVAPLPSSASGFPVGLVEDRRYQVETLRLERGDTLLLYTDGLIEARDGDDAEFGIDRVVALFAGHHALPPRALAARLLDDLGTFLGGMAATDDLSLMVIRRES